MIRALRSRLRGIYPLRSAYHCWLALLDQTRASRGKLYASLRRDFENADPWDYLQSDIQSERFRSALRLLDRVSRERLFESAMEVGCAEGVFTAMLASRCKSLISVDIIDVALERARARCEGLGVTFKKWDLMASPVPVRPQLMVVMDVLEYHFRPADIRNAREKLVAAIEPGGYLLLGGSRQNLFFETSWWGKRTLRGGKRHADFFAEHSDLELVSMETGDIFVNAIFRKKR